MLPAALYTRQTTYPPINQVDIAGYLLSKCVMSMHLHHITSISIGW